MNAPLRILMISPQFHPLTGGYERAAERLSHSLLARGHQVEVVAERRDRAWASREEIGGLLVHRTWCINRRYLHVTTSSISLFIFLLMKGRKFDVFHVHQMGWLASVTVICGRMLGRPVALKLTSTEDFGIQSLVSDRPTARYQCRLHRKIDICLATSDRAAREAISFGIPSENIKRIPNLLDTDRFRPPNPEDRGAVRRGLGVRREFLAIAVSRLDPVKQYEVMFEAWERFAQGKEQVRLVIVGDGPIESELREKAAKSSVSSSIDFVGAVEDPANWYQASDIFLLSSRLEGLSNSLMEALSSGLPVISTRVSGSEDVMGETEAGALVEVGDSSAMAMELARFHEDADLRDACASRARQYAKNHYSAPIVVEKIESAYRASIEKARSSSRKSNLPVHQK